MEERQRWSLLRASPRRPISKMWVPGTAWQPAQLHRDIGRTQACASVNSSACCARADLRAPFYEPQIALPSGACHA